MTGTDRGTGVKLGALSLCALVFVAAATGGLTRGVLTDREAAAASLTVNAGNAPGNAVDGGPATVAGNAPTDRGPEGDPDERDGGDTDADRSAGNEADSQQSENGTVDPPVADTPTDQAPGDTPTESPPADTPTRSQSPSTPDEDESSDPPTEDGLIDSPTENESTDAPTENESTGTPADNRSTATPTAQEPEDAPNATESGDGDGVGDAGNVPDDGQRTGLSLDSDGDPPRSGEARAAVRQDAARRRTVRADRRRDRSSPVGDSPFGIKRTGESFETALPVGTRAHVRGEKTAGEPTDRRTGGVRGRDGR